MAKSTDRLEFINKIVMNYCCKILCCLSHDFYNYCRYTKIDFLLKKYRFNFLVNNVNYTNLSSLL